MSFSKIDRGTVFRAIALLLCVVAIGCDATLTHTDGLRYRVRTPRKLRIVVFHLTGDSAALVVDRLHSTPISVIDLTTRAVNLEGADLASHALSVGFFDDGTLKSLKLTEESEVAETLEGAAKQLEKLPDAVEAVSRIDRARDLEEAEDLEAKKRRLDAERALLEARRALEEAREAGDDP